MVIEPKKIASGFSDWIPICEKNLLYELTASFLLTPDAPGIPKPIKLQEQMREFIDLKAPINEQAGQKMAAWAKGGEAPRQAVQSEPDPLDNPDVDMTILFNDLALEIQNAADVRTASSVFNRAVDEAVLPKGKMDALKVVMQERLKDLSKKR